MCYNGNIMVTIQWTTNYVTKVTTLGNIVVRRGQSHCSFVDQVQQKLCPRSITMSAMRVELFLHTSDAKPVWEGNLAYFGPTFKLAVYCLLKVEGVRVPDGKYQS